MNEITIHLKPTERFRRTQMLNHALPGVVLFVTGLATLLGDDSNHTWNPWLNIFAGSAVIATIVYEFKFVKQGTHKLVDWVDIFAGIVLNVEGINHLHPGKWFQPGVLYILIGMATIVKGILHSKVPQVRRITFDDKGFSAQSSLFRKLELRWENLSAGYIEGTKIRLATKDAKLHTINLRRVENKEEVFSAFNKRLVLERN
jgi:hypothetical protein